ncbi:hypothetical protein [Streptomyces griseorubens]|uniref:hypothetical protein n=1 Tax=Streptomyces griseorubens TaxID=66897 RepID=UPI000A7C1FE7|nr:hypothetical protein [Streptomyces griseorubens]
MNTPAPAAEDKPFEPKDFPKDLLAAQRKLAELYAALHAHQARLPWFREADDGWPKEPERWHRRGRPATAGWDAADAETYDQLWEDLRKTARRGRRAGVQEGRTHSRPGRCRAGCLTLPRSRPGGE